MQINVKNVEPCGSIAFGKGTVVESDTWPKPGMEVSFVGEYRMLAEIAEALDAGEEVVAEVPEWAVTDWQAAA